MKDLENKLYDAVKYVSRNLDSSKDIARFINSNPFSFNGYYKALIIAGTCILRGGLVGGTIEYLICGASSIESRVATGILAVAGLQGDMLRCFFKTQDFLEMKKNDPEEYKIMVEEINGERKR